MKMYKRVIFIVLVFALTILPVSLTGCDDDTYQHDSTAAPHPYISPGEIGSIYSAVIRQLVTIDNTFEENKYFPRLFIIRNPDDRAVNPRPVSSPSTSITPPFTVIPQAEQVEIMESLKDLRSDIIWIDKFRDADFEYYTPSGYTPTGSENLMPQSIKGGGAVLTLGSIFIQSDESVQVNGSIWIGNMGASGMAYTLEKQDEVWKIIGTTMLWIS